MRCTVIRIFLFIAGLLSISSGARAQCGLIQPQLILSADTVNGAPVAGKLTILTQPISPGWQLLSSHFIIDGQQTITDTLLELKDISSAGIHYVEAVQTAFNSTTGDTCTVTRGSYYLTTAQNLFTTIETNGNGLTQGFQAKLYGNGTLVNPVWNFGDGTQMNGISSAHTYAQPGVYKVTFTNGNGSFSSATRWIHAGDGQSNFYLTNTGFTQPVCDSVYFQPGTQVPYNFISADDPFNYNYLSTPLVLTGNFPGYNQWSPAPAVMNGRYHVPGQTLLYARMLDANGGDYTIYVPALISDSCFAPADTLTGYFWQDNDGDGLRDPSEALMSEPTFGMQTFSHLVNPDPKGKYKLPLPGITAVATPVAVTGENFTTPDRIICVPTGSGAKQLLNCGVALQQSMVSGKLFSDINKDTLYNGLVDRFLNGFTVEIKNMISGAVFTAVTNRDGEFNTLVPYGNYSVSIKTDLPGSKVIPDTQWVSVYAAATGLVPFAVQSVQSTADLEAILIPGITPVAGAPFSLYLLARNNGNDTCKGQFQIVYDNNLQFSSIYPANGIHDPVNHTVTWYSQTLYPTTDSLYRIQFTLPFSTPGDSLVNQSYIYVNPGFTDINLQNNAYAITTKLGNQQDPFTLSATPEGQGPQHFIASGDRVFYHIRYQNTGNGVLRNLIIQDELPAWLDRSTLRVEFSSYPFQIINRGNHYTFKYYNINLPDTSGGNLNVADLIISLKPYSFIPGGTVIENKVTAYADQHPPLNSDLVFQTIDLNAGLEAAQQSNVSVYPNPFRDEIIVTADGNRVLKVSMTDVAGREVSIVKANEGDRYNAAGISPGLYFLRVESEATIRVFRLVKN